MFKDSALGLWLFAPALDSVKLTLKDGFICPFAVIRPYRFRINN